METFTLNNGVKIPVIGFGTFQIPPEDTERCVAAALKAGYRCIDTAAGYANEEGVGAAIRKSGIPRDQIFVITKLWVQDTGYENTKIAFEKSLKKLGLDYINLYLIHMPFGDVYGSWRAMEEIYQQKKARAIGVSNFYPDRLVDLILHNKVVPAVNQIEFHPFYQEEQSLQINKEYNIVTQAWSPFAQGKNNIFTNPVLEKIAKAHNKSVSHVILRWVLQRGVQCIPKSVNEDRIVQNLNIFDFKLTDEEIAEINKFDGKVPLFPDHRTPEAAKMFGPWKVHD